MSVRTELSLIWEKGLSPFFFFLPVVNFPPTEGRSLKNNNCRRGEECAIPGSRGWCYSQLKRSSDVPRGRHPQPDLANSLRGLKMPNQRESTHLPPQLSWRQKRKVTLSANFSLHTKGVKKKKKKVELLLLTHTHTHTYITYRQAAWQTRLERIDVGRFSDSDVRGGLNVLCVYPLSTRPYMAVLLSGVFWEDRRGGREARSGGMEEGGRWGVVLVDGRY